MKWLYVCDSCGCYLDPGEGRLCEECQEKKHARVNEQKRIQNLLNINNAQISFRLEELV